jgi:hypothetical protein
LVTPGNQHDRFDESRSLSEASKRVLAPKRGGQFLGLGPVEVREARMKEREGLVGGVELGLECGRPLLKPVPLRLEVEPCEAISDGVDHLQDVAHALQLALGPAQAERGV